MHVKNMGWEREMRNYQKKDGKKGLKGIEVI